jgi:U3 small nucleolar RNA-associated protein 6
VSDFALVRRQFQILERALRKFKDDVGLWIQYINTAKREGARALVGRITARCAFSIPRYLPNCRTLTLACHSSRAIALHPNTPALYILAAAHELDHLSPAAARTLLQRGLRLNADSVDLWREYVKMELGFVESIRRRWAVLGISVGGKGKQAAGTADTVMDVDDENAVGTERPQVDMDVDAQAEADLARQEILEGAIVKSVLSGAVKGESREHVIAFVMSAPGA